MVYRKKNVWKHSDFSQLILHFCTIKEKFAAQSVYEWKKTDGNQIVPGMGNAIKKGRRKHSSSVDVIFCLKYTKNIKMHFRVFFLELLTH